MRFMIPVATNGSWSGTIRLAGMTSGNSSSQWLVCRVEYPSSTFQTDNERNHQPYASVAESLDSQNYYIKSSSDGTCPPLSVTTGNGQSAQTFSASDPNVEGRFDAIAARTCRTSR